MSIKSEDGGNIKVFGRVIEIAVYALVAGVLVGLVLFVNRTMGIGNDLLMLIGIVFAFLAIFQLTPITHLLIKGTVISSEVLSLVQDDEAQNNASPDIHRAALDKP